MEKDKQILTEENLITKGMWSSKSMWKAVSGVAVGVFLITMIYAQFLSMATTITTLSERVDKQNARLVEVDEKAEVEREALEDRQRENEFGDVRQQSTIDSNTKLAHERGK
jgi:hypothetical protein